MSKTHDVNLARNPIIGKQYVIFITGNELERHHLTIRLRARVFYEQIVNEAQPSWLSLVESEGE